MVVDRDVHEVPALARVVHAGPAAVEAMATAVIDPSELLHIQVEQIRPDAATRSAGPDRRCVSLDGTARGGAAPRRSSSGRCAAAMTANAGRRCEAAWL